MDRTERSGNSHPGPNLVADVIFNQQLKRLRWQNSEGARTPEGTVQFIRETRERWTRFIAETGRQPE